MGTGKEFLRILLRKKPSEIRYREVLERKIGRKRRIRIPAAFLDLSLINAQMLPHDIADIVNKDIDPALILGIIRFQVLKCGRQHF